MPRRRQDGPGLSPEEARALLEAERSRRRQLEERLLRSLWRNEAHRRLAESNIIGVILADTDGRIRSANGEFLRILGYEREDIAEGRLRWDELTPPEHRENDRKALEALEIHGIAPAWEKEYVARDGRRVPVMFGLARLESSDYQTIAFVLDLTERKQAEERAARYAEALRARSDEMEEDLRMARELQRSYLPRVLPCFPADAPPEQSALRFHHAYQPAAEVGGDLFDIVTLSEREAGVLVCDVMGHGVRAALVTAMIRALFEHVAPTLGEPGALLSALNRGLLGSLRRTGSPMFVTACYAIVDAVTGQVRWANAGHPGPLLVTGGGAARVLEGERGPALGLLETAAYPEAGHRLDAGDTFLLYTDGLYGLEEGSDPGLLARRVEALLPSAPAALVARLLEPLRGEGGGPELDDVCVVAIELTRRLERLRRPAAPPPGAAAR